MVNKAFQLYKSTSISFKFKQSLRKWYKIKTFSCHSLLKEEQKKENGRGIRAYVEVFFKVHSIVVLNNELRMTNVIKPLS